MIIRNEADKIHNCLEQVAGVADEIIVVDNASTDGSAEMAKRYPVSLIQSPASQTLDKSRNLYLKEASHPWIISLDADEVILSDDLRRLKSWLSCIENVVSCVLLPIYSYFGEGRWCSFRVARVVRNGLGIRYTSNGLHDTVGYSARLYGDVQVAPFPIHHFDALYRDRSAAKRSAYRTAIYSLLKSSEISAEERARMHRYLGLEFIAVRNFGTAEGILRQGLALSPSTEENSRVYLAQLFRYQGRYKDARAVLAEVTDRSWGPTCQIPVIAAEIALNEGNLGSALRCYEEGLNDDPAAAYLHLNIARLLRNGRVAKEHRDRAFELNPFLRDRAIYGEGGRWNSYYIQDCILRQ